MSSAASSRAFGAQNRARLINDYFSGRPATGARGSWEHFYRLLLWVDQTNGLAHCYESDKSQPGKNWYGRSLALHAWLSAQFGVAPKELAENVDWLFRRATADLAAEVLRSAQKRLERAEAQRQPFANRDLPKPGEDPELVAIVREVLGTDLTAGVSEAKWQELVQRVRQYLALENKRKNLLGEGFEDVIAAVASRALAGSKIEIRARSLLHDLPGFNRPVKGEKANKVDVAVLRPRDGQRTLVTAKWSVRADREKVFATDYADYVKAESNNQPFEYVFVTNEFDPARLMRACEQLAGRSPLFSHVVHVNPDAVKATYGAGASESSMKAVLGHIRTGRLIGFDRWLSILKK